MNKAKPTEAHKNNKEEGREKEGGLGLGLMPSRRVCSPLNNHRRSIDLGHAGM